MHLLPLSTLNVIAASLEGSIDQIESGETLFEEQYEDDLRHALLIVNAIITLKKEEAA